MAYYGSWKIDDYLTFACNTHTASTGAATDADSVPTYAIYEDESGTAIASGSMAKLDDAGTLGFYSERVQLTTAIGYEKGKCYTIYITATVASVAGTMHHNFQMEAEVDANTVSASNVSSNVVQWLGQACAAVTVNGVPEVDVTHFNGTAGTFASGRPEVNTTHAAGTAWNSGGITNNTFAADALTAAKFHADVSTEFATTLLGTAVPGAFGAGTLGRVIGRSCPDVVAGGTNGLFIAGTNAATSVTTSFTTTFTGNLTGTVGGIAAGGYAGGYDNACVWIDTGNGAAGTTNYVHGIITNPNSSMANSRTIANSLKLTGFHIANGSSVTLDQGYNNFTFFGEEWTLALANRAIGNSRFNGATVTGLSSGSGGTFFDCHMGTCTLDPCNIEHSALIGGSTITVGTAGNFVFSDCHSSLSTDNDPVFDFGAAVGASTLNLRRYAGGITIANLKSGDVFEFGGTGRLTLAASCTAGTVRIRGCIRLINNGSGMTIEDSARWDEDQSIAVVNALAANIITAAATHADFGTELAAAVMGKAGADPSGVPAANASMEDKINWICAWFRNKQTMNRSTGVVNLRNDADGATIGTYTGTDDGTTFTRPEVT